MSGSFSDSFLQNDIYVHTYTFMLSCFSHVWLCVTLWAVACQAPLGFSRQEYIIGFPCLPPRDLPYPGIEPTLAGMFFTTRATWEAYSQTRFRDWTIAMLQALFQMVSETNRRERRRSAQRKIWGPQCGWNTDCEGRCMRYLGWASSLLESKLCEG